MTTLLLGAGAVVAVLTGACFVVLATSGGYTWADVIAQGSVMGFLTVVAVAALGFVGYPLAKAEAKVRECEGCPEKGGTGND